MSASQGSVEAHYGGERFAERILEAAAKDGVSITPASLAGADQFHGGGIDATRGLARLGNLEPGTMVLDIGSGLGGPARVLASEFGCDVTGLDLTPEFVRSGRELTEACGLSASVRFELGDATAMPFDDNAFDVAWTQHAVMNIHDRAGLWSEAYRVVKPGGRLLMHDVLRGSGSEPEFPLPWARDPSVSFLQTVKETQESLDSVGFEREEWREVPAAMAETFRAIAMGDSTQALTLQVVMGPDLPERLGNFFAAFSDGRLVLAQGVFRKPLG
jgi:SAM-dependent methyltransferase